LINLELTTLENHIPWAKPREGPTSLKLIQGKDLVLLGSDMGRTQFHVHNYILDPTLPIPLDRGGRKGGQAGPGPPLKYSAPIIYIYIYIGN